MRFAAPSSRAFVAGAAMILALAAPAARGDEAAAPPNTLTAAEAKEGFRLLFDGKTTKGWRGFKKADFPARAWVVQEGTLTHVARAKGETGGGNDIVSTDRFSE